MLARLLTFVVWALVAASGVYWGLKVFVRAPAAPAQLTLAAARPSLQVDWSRLFGPDLVPVAAEAAPPPALDARFQLVGVVAPRHSGQGGVALIAVDGKPAKPYRVGTTVDGALVLQDVRTREALLGPAGAAAQVRLQMPLIPVAAVGTPLARPATPGAMFGVTPPVAPAPASLAPLPLPRQAAAPTEELSAATPSASTPRQRMGMGTRGLPFGAETR